MSIPEHKQFLSHSVTQPIFLSNNFTHDSIYHPERTKYSYSRTKNPNFTNLEECIQKIYGTENTILCCSGTLAISSVFNVLYDAKANNVFIVDREIYGGTKSLLKYMKNKFTNLIIEVVDLTNIRLLKKIFDKYGTSIKLIFTESCSNPSGRYIDTQSIHNIYKINYPNLEIIVDNSWLSALYNPIKFGATIIVESLSKYMSSGDAIMGMITGKNNEVMNNIKRYANCNGIRTSQFDAYNLVKSISTLNFRLEKVSNTALKIATFLESLPCISSVMYPLLESHPTFEVSNKFLEFGPGVIWFHIPIIYTKAIELLGSSNKILFATSYGKAESLFDPYPKIQKLKLGSKTICGTWLRLAIGYAQTEQEIKNELVLMFLKFLAIPIENIPTDALTDNNLFAINENNIFIPSNDLDDLNNIKGKLYKWINIE